MNEYLEELRHLLGNAAHWTFEGITDMAFFILGAFLFRPIADRWLARRLRKHDEEVHNHGHQDSA